MLSELQLTWTHISTVNSKAIYKLSGQKLKIYEEIYKGNLHIIIIYCSCAFKK